jgi:type VI secretion system secreted protein Hcp
MASDMFLKIDGIKGESQDKAHKGEIDVLQWSFGASNSGTFHSGSGGGSGKATVRDFVFKKQVDAASPELLKHILTGRHFTEAKLVVRKTGDTPLEYLTLVMKKVLVAMVDIESDPKTGILNEIIILNFAGLQYAYTSQNAKGGKEDFYSFGYDIAGNTIV